MANLQSQDYDEHCNEEYDSLNYESDLEDVMDESDSSGWDTDNETQSTDSNESELELGIDVISILSARAASNGRMLYYVKWRWNDEERIRLTWESDWFFQSAKCGKPIAALRRVRFSLATTQQ